MFRFVGPPLLTLLMTGCSSYRGQLDFVTAPEHEWHIGSWTMLAYPSQTVLRIGATYYAVDISFHLLVVAIIALTVFAIIARVVWRRARREKSGG